MSRIDHQLIPSQKKKKKKKKKKQHVIFESNLTVSFNYRQFKKFRDYRVLLYLQLFLESLVLLDRLYLLVGPVLNSYTSKLKQLIFM